MRITAPDAWLDEVDVTKLWQWFLLHGFRPLPSHPNVLGHEDVNVLLAPELRRWVDWRHRLLDAIEIAAGMESITAAEWFLRERGKA